MATDNQIQIIQGLLDRRQVPADDRPAHISVLMGWTAPIGVLDDMTANEASQVIHKLRNSRTWGKDNDDTKNCAAVVAAE